MYSAFELSLYHATVRVKHFLMNNLVLWLD